MFTERLEPTPGIREQQDPQQKYASFGNFSKIRLGLTEAIG
jgi:hypothetical protein